MWVTNGTEKTRYEKAKEFFYDAIEYNKPKTLKEICIEVSELNPEEVSLREIIEYSLPFIFDEVFPIHDEKHRAVLERKIVQHYFFRQICCEDVEEWKLRLNTALNEIMPYYNKMYESYDYLVDILDNVNYERKIDEENSGIVNERNSTNNKTESTADSASSADMQSHNIEENTVKIGYSDTPQGALSGVDTDTYLTNYQRTSNDTEKTQTSNSTTAAVDKSRTDMEGNFESEKDNSGIMNRIEKVKGKMYGNTKSNMVMEYRKAIINIDLDIIKDLRPLFLNIYN